MFGPAIVPVVGIASGILEGQSTAYAQPVNPIAGGNSDGRGSAIGHYRTTGSRTRSTMPVYGNNFGSVTDENVSDGYYVNINPNTGAVSTRFNEGYSDTNLDDDDYNWWSSSRDMYSDMSKGYKGGTDRISGYQDPFSRAFVYGFASPFYRVSEGKWYRTKKAKGVSQGGSTPLYPFKKERARNLASNVTISRRKKVSKQTEAWGSSRWYSNGKPKKTRRKFKSPRRHLYAHY